MLWKTLRCLALAGCLLAQGPAEEAAIRQVVQKYVDARESKDAQGIEALFTSDADQLVSTGEWRKGRAAVVKGTMASSQNSGGTRTITVTSVRFVAPGVAIADGRYEISGMTNGASRKMWASLTLTRVADGWRIAAIRNMLPAGQ
ncbi:MAG: SgcJ/EcaC family oxidoreductase [Candidatus Sulfopaludibacter sp.]|nr:SgcJ/EcaC family oxidoreductase [Candidatus Sulfopaludibacter sp.]